jgi:DNA replication and repair protein RecF
MLYLTSLHLSHFRSHKLLELECDARPVALFGANGSGKTNILEAVSLFSPGRGLRRASAEDMARRPEQIGWKLRGALTAQGRQHEIELSSRNGAARSTKIDGKTASQTALGGVTRVLWLVPAMDRLWIEGAEGRRRFWDRIALSFFPSHAEHSLSYEKAMRERNRLLKDQVTDDHWYRALEHQMALSGVAIMQARQAALAYIHDAQIAASTQFPKAKLTLLQSENGPLPDRVEDLSAAFASARARDLAAGRSLLGPHRTDLSALYLSKDMPAKECSTGEQKALLISIILANARALAEQISAPPILLLDEVAAHLDAQRRAALYTEINTLKAQAWMTGTGPELFEDLGEAALMLELGDSGSGSFIKPA